VGTKLLAGLTATPIIDGAPVNEKMKPLKAPEFVTPDVKRSKLNVVGPISILPSLHVLPSDRNVNVLIGNSTWEPTVALTTLEIRLVSAGALQQYSAALTVLPSRVVVAA